MKNGFPLYVQIDPSNKNDAKIGTSMIASLNDGELNNCKMLADSGYDSAIFKKCLESIKCTHIIPKNRRGTLDKDIKDKMLVEKKKITHVTSKSKRVIWDQIKTIRNKKITSRHKNKIFKLKEELRKLAQQVKEKIKLSALFIKAQGKKNRKKTFNIGLSNADKVIYKKRSYVEHVYAFLKSHRLDKIMCRSISTLYNNVYSVLIDRILFEKVCHITT